MAGKKDTELLALKESMGEKAYWNEYKRLYMKASFDSERDVRFSGLSYTNSKEKLDAVREKYKHGISREIIEQTFEVWSKGIKE